MSQLNVRAALETRLAAFATSKSLPVVWENIKTLPSGSYLIAHMFPANTQDPSFGNKHKRYTGLFRVTFYSTDINKGLAAVQSTVEDLVNYFPRGLELSAGGLVTNITNTPSLLSPGYESTYIYITVDILYRADEIAA